MLQAIRIDAIDQLLQYAGCAPAAASFPSAQHGEAVVRADEGDRAAARAMQAAAKPADVQAAGFEGA